MSRRTAKLVLLCEDAQHEAFARRFLVEEGWHPRAIRVQRSPRGRGAGEQWVRARYPMELHTLRAVHVSTVLAVMVDADGSTVQERVAALESSCAAAGVPARKADDRVAIIVPRRNIETWLAYLDGEQVDESKVYPRLNRARDCINHVRVLKGMCDEGSLRVPAPPSLDTACLEYQRIASVG
jgi:hypothetical protein